MKIARLVIVLCLLGVTGCDQPSPVDRELPAPRSTQGNSTRFKVRQVQLVEDPLAYGGTRGVYIITDTETGVEYMGVSGIGISEVGSHSVPGKNARRRTDER